MSTSTPSSILIQALDRLDNRPFFHVLFKLNIRTHDDVLGYRDMPDVLAELTKHAISVSCVRMIINTIDEIQLYPANVYPSFVHPIEPKVEPKVEPQFIISDDEIQKNEESDILNVNENILVTNDINDTNDNSDNSNVCNDDIMEIEEYNEENDGNNEENKSNNKNKESEIPIAKRRSKRLMVQKKKNSKEVSNYSRMKNKRKPSKIFTCNQCNYWTTMKNTLKYHEVIHSDERPFKCTECNFASRWKHNLTRHIKVHAKRNKPYQCLKCKKRFAETSAREQHIKRNKCVRVNKKSSKKL